MNYVWVLLAMAYEKSAFNFFAIETTDNVILYVNPYILATNCELFRKIINNLTNEKPLKMECGSAWFWSNFCFDCLQSDKFDTEVKQYCDHYVFDKKKEMNFAHVLDNILFYEHIGYHKPSIKRWFQNRLDIIEEYDVVKTNIKITESELKGIPDEYIDIIMKKCATFRVTESGTKVTYSINYSLIELLNKIDTQRVNRLNTLFIIANNNAKYFIEEYDKNPDKFPITLIR